MFVIWCVYPSSPCAKFIVLKHSPSPSLPINHLVPVSSPCPLPGIYFSTPNLVNFLSSLSVQVFSSPGSPPLTLQASRILLFELPECLPHILLLVLVSHALFDCIEFIHPFPPTSPKLLENKHSILTAFIPKTMANALHIV